MRSGQLYDHGRALPGVAGESYGASVRFRELAHDRQSKAGACGTMTMRRLMYTAHETVEDVMLLFLRYTYTIVLNRELYVGMVWNERYRYVSVRFAVIDCILE